jgi:citrate lyase subunit beta/citryl-CoA lyase
VLQRSSLYVPGDRPDLLEKALHRSADSLIADLEDAVAPGRKDVALQAVQRWLAGDTEAVHARPGPGVARPQLWVRLNPGPRGIAEATVLATQPSVRGFMLAKTQSMTHVSEIARILAAADSSAELVPLLEDAQAVLDMAQFATAPRVVRLQVGEADLRAQLGVSGSADGHGLLHVRSQLVLVSAAAGIDPPMAPVFTKFRDLEAMRSNSVYFSDLGFFGRACIHPDQIDVANEVFTPSVDEIVHARAVLAAHDNGGASQLDGEFVDEAIVRVARRVLALVDEVR